MGYDEKTAARVRRILSRRRDVVEKKMVGGLSFMVNGRMCCGLTSIAFMVRVGPDAVERALALPHARPMEFAGRRLSGFVYVDPAGYRTDAALAKWVQRGIAFVSTLPAKQPAARRPRPTPPRRYPRGERVAKE
jgi:TfoX N-terminal domain